jgi:hypothetical protein
MSISDRVNARCRPRTAAQVHEVQSLSVAGCAWRMLSIPRNDADAHVTFWRRFGAVLALFWRCFGAVLALFWRCLGLSLGGLS